MINKADKNKVRKVRHIRVRRKISGTPERPRLNVYRSNKNIYAQIIDDVSKKTLFSASSNEKDFPIKNGGNKEAAKEVGKLIAQRALEGNVETVVFDRGGYLYHGRIKELSDGAREAGLKF